MDNPNKTLREYIEEANKRLAERNSAMIVDGKAESYLCIMTADRARSLFKGGLPNSLAGRVSFVERGHTFYIKAVGLAFSVKRKKVKVTSSNRETLYAYSIELKYDRDNMIDLPLVDIQDIATENVHLTTKRAEEVRKTNLDTFKGMLDKHGLDMAGYEALSRAYRALDYQDKRTLGGF